MKRYEMNKQKEGSITYFFIRDTETWDIVLLPTKYLMHMTKAKCSPNTVRRSGCSILYYLEYIEEKEKKLTDVYEMSFTEQTKYFVEFLYWLKAGKHTSGKMNILPNNGTCNAYLKDVFRFYVFIEEEFSQFGGLKVLSYSQFTAVDSVGLKKTIRSRSFKGYLKEEEHKARTAKKDEIIEILKACTNIRDRLLILLLAETGYRIGEILGINYMNDIDYSNQVIRVYFREDNENGARAKNAEYRSAKISADTFQFLNCYIAEYRKILQHQSYLFVNISGRTVGNPLTVDAVYAMLKRMEKKTGIKITPHMLRHYFGNERRKAGWALELIQIAYGHRHIQTTINYLDIVDDELLEASQEFYKKNTALYGIDELLKEVIGMPAVLQQWIEKSEERNRRIQQLRNEVTEIMELNVMDVTYRMLVEFLADEEIEHISEMDYILRKRYEVYMSELIKEKSVSRYLRIFDKVKQEYIRKRIETPMGRLECQWTYKNTILFIPYHSDQKIVLSVERVKNRSNMVWDFQIDSSEKMKRQIFDVLEFILENYEPSRVREQKLTGLHIFYEFCRLRKIEDINCLEQVQEEDDLF